MTEKLIEEINELSDKCYEISQELAEIESREDTGWLELRKECKTDKECDKRWGATPDGSRHKYLKWLWKGLEKKRGGRILEFKSNAGFQ